MAVDKNLVSQSLEVSFQVQQQVAVRLRGALVKQTDTLCIDRLRLCRDLGWNSRLAKSLAAEVEHRHPLAVLGSALAQRLYKRLPFIKLLQPGPVLPRE